MNYSRSKIIISQDMSIVALLIDLQYLLSLVLQSASPFLPIWGCVSAPFPKKEGVKATKLWKKTNSISSPVPGDFDKIGE